jgi:hypothetical protein
VRFLVLIVLLNFREEFFQFAFLLRAFNTWDTSSVVVIEEKVAFGFVGQLLSY